MKVKFYLDFKQFQIDCPKQADPINDEYISGVNALFRQAFANRITNLIPPGVALFQERYAGYGTLTGASNHQIEITYVGGE